MKVIVPIKRTIDAYVTIQVKADESGVENQNVKMSMNPFDEIAVEEAVRLKENGTASEVIVITIGTSAATDVLRNALAIGADRATHIISDKELQPLAIAKTLKAFIEKEAGDLVIMGKQAIDNDNNQTGQMLAGLLGWAQGTFISEQIIESDTVKVTREIDGGLQELSLKLPAVLTSDLRLNEPRYIKLPNMMKAKKKTIEELSFADLSVVDIDNRIEVNQISEPVERQQGIIVNSVDELVEKLKSVNAI